MLWDDWSRLVFMACVVFASCGGDGDFESDKSSIKSALALSSQLPCDYPGAVLRSSDGRIIRFDSDEMKARAIRKADVDGFMKQLDVKGTVIFDILVGTSGEVVCVKGFVGHPLIRVGVEKALRSWRFKTQRAGSENIPYLGRMQFSLCNINCGEQGPSMTLLQ